jgi:hypothetical protein
MRARLRRATLAGALLFGILPTTRVTLRPWFRNRHLRALATGTPVRSRSGRAGLAGVVGRLWAIRGGAA